MKLSKREKILISILLIVIAGYFGYKYIPFDNIFKLDKLEAEYSQKKATYEAMSQNIVSTAAFEEKKQALVDEINKTNILSDLQQEQLIVFLNTYLSSKNVNANNISFTELSVIPMTTAVAAKLPKPISSLEAMMNEINNGKASTENKAVENNKTEGNTSADTNADTNQAPQNNNAASQDGLTVRTMSANVGFESTYEDMISFIDAIQNSPIDISIVNINTVTAENGLLQGTMALNFYSAPKPEGYVEENTDWMWKDLVQSGKSNPFKLEGGTAFTGTVGNKFDFYLSLKPESSDLPTVIVGKAEDKNRLTYVYADSNTMENVSMQFKKENDKYYYRYSTKNGKFPNDGSWLDFTPVGSSISVKVYSSKRNSKADSAGANINIENNSGLKLLFEIEGDDKENPRVYFNDPKSVRVIRK